MVLWAGFPTHCPLDILHLFLVDFLCTCVFVRALAAADHATGCRLAAHLFMLLAELASGAPVNCAMTLIVLPVKRFARLFLRMSTWLCFALYFPASHACFVRKATGLRCARALPVRVTSDDRQYGQIYS